jgi:hypothetical protein
LFRLDLVLQNKGLYQLTASPKALTATDWGDAYLVQAEYFNGKFTLSKRSAADKSAIFL